MIRRYVLLAAAFAVYACGDPSAEAGAAGERHDDSVAAAAPSPPANPQEPGLVPDSLEMANAQLTRQRQATMSKYAECMTQVRGVPEQARRKIAEACANLPDAPK
jgi:hypothetical protein